MAGVRITDVPKSVTEKQLKIHFSKPENNGGKIKKIYFPLFNNDAVILFESLRVSDIEDLIKNEHKVASQVVGIQRLPEHMLFTSMAAKLDQNASVLVQATSSLRDEMQFAEGIRISEEGDQQTCTLHGNWFQLEWAWHYLDCFMQQQEIIQSQISQKSQQTSAMPMDVDDSEYGSRKRTQLRPSSPTEVTTTLRNSIAQRSEQTRSLGSASVRSPARSEDTDSGDGYSSSEALPGRHTDTYSRHGFDQYDKSVLLHGNDKESSHSGSIGGPLSKDSLKKNIKKSYRSDGLGTGSRYIVQASASQRSSGQDPPTLDSDEEDNSLDLQGTGYKVPFESVHSTLNMENRVRRSDENSTFEQFSGLDLNHRSSPQISPSSSLRIDISGNSKRSHKDRQSDEGSTTSGSGASSLAHSVGHDSMTNSKHGASSLTSAKAEPVTSAVLSRIPHLSMAGHLPHSYAEDQLVCQFDIKGIKMVVYYGDIIKEEADAVVNAANEQLDHMGGLAYAMSKARGPEMQRESNEYTRKHGALKTTEVTSTSGGGEIKATHIIHAAGPMWFEFKKDKVPGQITQTYLNCFNYANEKLWISSIAVPAISTGVYGAPLDICVRSFLDAVLIFRNNQDMLPRLREIRLVNRDAECTVTSIVIIQTLLEAGIETLTTEALDSFKKLSEPSRRDLNLPRGRPEKSGSFSKTLSMEDKQSYTSMTSASPSVSGKWTQHRRSSSLSRVPARKAYDDNGDDGKVKKFDSKTMKFKTEADKSDEDSNSDTMTKSDRRGRPRTSSVSLGEKSAYKSKTEAERGSHTASLRSTIGRSSTPRLSEASKTYKRPSTAESISKSAPPIKQSLMTGSERMKSLKTSPSAGGSRSRAFVSSLSVPYDASVSPPSIKSEYTRTGHGEMHGGHVEDDYEFGLHSLPVDMNHGTFREKFLQMNQPDKKVDICVICLDTVKRPKVLTKCKHKFCTACIDEHFSKSKPSCPTCGTLYGVVRGDQPKGGTMTYAVKRDLLLPGYEQEEGTIIISYTFPSGIQEQRHPHPGRHYKGFTRKTYLPNSSEGKEVLRLLKKAFDCRLVFTIGDSRTTGQSGMLTWNDIHHKTSIKGGPTQFGYPDPTYLKRVKEELAMKGITSET